MIKKNGLWAVFAATLTPSLIIDPHLKSWKILAANKTIQKVTGKLPSRIEGMYVLDFFREISAGIDPTIYKKIESSLLAVCSSGASKDILMVDVILPSESSFKNLNRKWNIRITPIIIAKKTETILLSIQDKTNQVLFKEKIKTHYQQLDIQQQTYQKYFYMNPDLLFRLDIHGRLVEANKAFLTFFSISAEQLKSVKLANLVDITEKEILQRIIQKSMKGDTLTAKLHFTPFKGRKAIMDIKLVPINIRKTLIGISGTMIDRSVDMEQQHKLLIKSIYSEAVSKISEILIAEGEYEKQIYQTFNVLGNALMVDRIAMYKKEILTPSGQLITDRKLEWSKTIRKTRSSPPFYRFILDDMKEIKETLINDKIWRASVGTLPKGQIKSKLLEHHITSIAIIPIFINNKFTALITLEDVEDDIPFSLEELKFLSNVKSLITIAMEREEILQGKQESAKLYERLTQTIPGIAYRCLADEYLTMVLLNPEFVKMTGIEIDEILYNRSKSFTELIHKDDRKEFMNAQINGPKYVNQNIRILDSSGNYKWVENRSIKIFGNKNKAEYIDGVLLKR